MDEGLIPPLSIDYDDLNDSGDTSLEIESGSSKWKRSPTKLSPHLRGLMGEANIQLATGNIDKAEKMCFEIIRQIPDAYEPYLTLAQIYENHNIKKYKGFLMLAGHLQPSNTEIWCRLANAELQDNQVNAAITYYTNAIKSAPQDLELHRKRLKLVQERMPNRSRSVRVLKLNLAKAMPVSNHEEILKICSEVAKEYFESKNYLKAIDALKICIRRIPENTSQDILNMMLELLLISERYSECLDIFTQFCGFQFDLFVGEDMTITIHSYNIPDNLHMDLKVKFIVCFIGLQCYHLVEGLVKAMLEKDDIEKHGTLYLEIAEALMNSRYYAAALDLLVPLVKSRNFSLAGIWLKHAECLTQLCLYDQAIDAYKNVINMAPNHVEVLYPLAMLLLKQNRKQEALEVLSQDLSSGKLHVAVLIEQMKLLRQIGDLENYWKCCELLLSRHCIVFKHFTELRVALLSTTSVKEKQSKVARMRIIRGEDDDLDSNLESILEPPVYEEYKLYREILEFALKNKEYVQLQKLAFMGMASKRFSRYFTQIFIIGGYACLYAKDYYHGYLIARELLFHYPESNNAWNLYSLMIDRLEESLKIHRFFEGSTVKERMPVANMERVKANHYLNVAYYPDCLNYFLKEYKQCRSSYSAFMIGLVMLQQYSQRKKHRIDKKSMMEMVTYLFFNYAKIRSKYAQQEVYYNLGRMYQHIGIFYMAEHFYKLVFKVQNKYIEKYPDCVDLKMEAAYNLHLIYKNSGNLAAAKKVLWEYVVI